MNSRRNLLLVSVLTLMLPIFVFLCGCQEKAPEPSAPGYYSGPMKQKNTGTSQDGAAKGKTNVQ